MVLVPCGQGPVVIHRHWGGGRVSHAAHTLRHSSKSGAGLRALGPRGSSGDAAGSRTRWAPVTALTSCVRTKACTLLGPVDVRVLLLLMRMLQGLLDVRVLLGTPQWT